ncbi:MAG: leucine-rich repeat domain-containing protein, partial [Treponema sp.]|nr:leucine-rich repeat domain-containing protein [Treponema sp.]
FTKDQKALIACPAGKKGAYAIPAGVTVIKSAAFEGCTGLTSVNIPASVTEIGDAAFYGCTGLTSVSIPASVTVIGDEAFCGCTGLTGVTLSRRTRVENGAFPEGTRLTYSG